jgi:thiol-disulfide isomerase/thioredoxin
MAVCALGAGLLAGSWVAGADVNPNAPYHDDADSHRDLAAARQRAAATRHLVMVIFGANWCPDCIVLHHSLDTGATEKYAREHFDVVDVSVGEFDPQLGRYNRNWELAEELGVTLKKGIPAAVILRPDGRVVGRTMNGELEASRRYSPEQILDFLRGIVERQTVDFPDHR